MTIRQWLMQETEEAMKLPRDRRWIEKQIMTKDSLDLMYKLKVSADNEMRELGMTMENCAYETERKQWVVEYYKKYGENSSLEIVNLP